MEKIFYISNLDCAHCGAKIEEAINKLDGVESAVLIFPLKKIRVRGELGSDLLSAMNKTAAAIEPGVVISADEPVIEELHHHEHSCHGEHSSEHEHSHGHSHETENKRIDIITFAAGVVLFIGAIIFGKVLHMELPELIFCGCAYLLLGYNVLFATVKNIKSLNFFDENTLMTVATLGAFAIGELFEAVGVVLFFRIGEMFEEFAVSRSRKAITEAAALKVDEADLLRDGEFMRVNSEEIGVGDIIRIRTGERIAADGVVESGSSRIDTSAINGEPVPLTVNQGDQVMSGCINLSDTFTVRVTAAVKDPMISKVAEAIEDASAGKPKIERFITRFAKIYTPAVIAAAVLTAIVPSLITGEWNRWIHSALTFLVISCPCALVLSVPLAYFSGIGAASKLGILFKGGDSVEALGKVRSIIFDKTGTLTNGSFSVTKIESFGSMSEDELLEICGSCEQVSLHPVAVSIAECCAARGISLTGPESSCELAGRGIEAVLQGRGVLCGNERLMNEKGTKLPTAEKIAIGSEVYISVNGVAEGRIVVSDSVKKTSREAISNLKKMGIRTYMMTGDRPENAQAVSEELGLDGSWGGLMPQQKLERLEDIRRESGAVMFVGDGINDGPVLAGADVGGAMQTGADLALEAADAVFMNSEPESVVRAKKIADKALKISYQNIIFALVVKAAVLVLGLIGHPNMWLAVFADSGTAMLLIMNSIRILNTKKY